MVKRVTLVVAGLVVGLALSACGKRSTGTQDAVAAADGPSTHDIGQQPDSGGADLIPLADVAPDATPPDLPPVTPDASNCTCKPGDVWLRGPCVPTYQLFTCGKTCDTTNPASCGNPSTGQYKCDACAAAASCVSSACKPACVPGPAMGFKPGVLRITPTSGIAGQTTTLTIEGGELYVGALIWYARMGTFQGTINPLGGCSIKATFTPGKPGIYPVEVTYGGGQPWALAGFYTASGGSIPPKLAQPGYTCGAGAACASAAPYTCSCVSGRCVCK